ncbi:MAG: hypothetical protein JSS66_11450 [Armatimonadetes bacterium]|nr:hypothetical protein [Armatimonadota bacterium]
MKKPQPLTMTLVASLTALAALASAVIARVDPMTCLLRGLAAFFAGKLLTGVWCALFPAEDVGRNDGPEMDPPLGESVSGNEAEAA